MKAVGNTVLYRKMKQGRFLLRSISIIRNSKNSVYLIYLENVLESSDQALYGPGSSIA